MRNKLFALLVGIVLVVFGVGYVLTRDVVAPSQEVPTSPPAVVLVRPQRIEIPKLGITAPIDLVGLDAHNGMAITNNPLNVAWYAQGYLVGQQGNAVMAGHVDTPQLQPAIFARLHELQVGDEVIVHQNNERMVFKVTAVAIYPVRTFPLEQVFGKANTVNLNLITCSGKLYNGQYPDRLVVFTTKI